jgi:hypothetical protein
LCCFEWCAYTVDWDAVGAIATAAAVITALWGDWFRDKLAGPKLRIAIERPEGHMTKVWINGDPEKAVPARYYPVEVSNLRNWAAAKGVKVYLFDALRENATRTGKWDSILPVRPLEFEGIGPGEWIGPVRQANILKVFEKAGAHLVLTPGAPFALDWDPDLKTPVRLVVAAHAENGESDRVTIEVSWDRVWDARDAEMAKHLTMRVVAKG